MPNLAPVFEWAVPAWGPTTIGLTARHQSNRRRFEVLSLELQSLMKGEFKNRHDRSSLHDRPWNFQVGWKEAVRFQCNHGEGTCWLTSQSLPNPNASLFRWFKGPSFDTVTLKSAFSMPISLPGNSCGKVKVPMSVREDSYSWTPTVSKVRFKQNGLFWTDDIQLSVPKVFAGQQQTVFIKPLRVQNRVWFKLHLNLWLKLASKVVDRT